VYEPQTQDKEPENREIVLARLKEEMQRAAKELRFEDAAKLRDKIKRMEADE